MRTSVLESEVVVAKPTTVLRLPYTTPTLERLGSVRELVLGATGVRNDLRGGRRP